MADRLVLVRHGETAWSRSGQHTSVTDLALTTNGQSAAAALGPRLDAIGIDYALTSPRRRARETASLARLHVDAVIDDDLAEWAYGEYEGMTTEAIHTSNPGWSLWTDGSPGGESPSEVMARTHRFIERCADIGGNVACFAHGHILRALTLTWLGIAYEYGEQFPLGTSSISILGYSKGRQSLEMWNA